MTPTDKYPISQPSLPPYCRKNLNSSQGRGEWAGISIASGRWFQFSYLAWRTPKHMNSRAVAVSRKAVVKYSRETAMASFGTIVYAPHLLVYTSSHRSSCACAVARLSIEIWA